MKRWAKLEQDTAEALGGRRIVEDWTLFHERPDVLVDLPTGRRLVVDCKAYRRFSHHALLDAIREKYCASEQDIPCLVSKSEQQRGAYATLPLDTLADLLEKLRNRKPTMACAPRTATGASADTPETLTAL